MSLDDKKNIILAVTGGIAAYKSCELARLFVKANYNVRVVMTKNAEQFVGPITFASLTNNPVLRADEFEMQQKSDEDLAQKSPHTMAHIDFAQWGDLFIVAPATANAIAKLRAGICDDAFSTQALAFDGPKLVAPAMNSRMWNAEVTQENIACLKQRHYKFIEPDQGLLACGEVGIGKLADIELIFAEAESLLKGRQELKGKKVLITSGPTRSYIDDVRFITNRSSGKMGVALAREASRKGAEVVLVTGPVDPSLLNLESVEIHRVETNAQMIAACEQEASGADIIFAAAAVSDFELAEPRNGKIVRAHSLNLKLDAATDIIAEIAKKKTNKQVFFGFAAEHGLNQEKAQEKLRRKNLDFIALNDISRSDIGFDSDDNEMQVFSRTEAVFTLSKKTKAQIACELLDIAIQEI